MIKVAFSLTYHGSLADRHQLDFYDAAQALLGFQRSLALTTHLVLNGEIITQAPALKGAVIHLSTPEEGSWKVLTVVGLLATGAYNIGTAPKDTVIGHLTASAYDYAISELLGFHVDFDKTLGQQYEEMQASRRKKIPIPKPTQSKMDALLEKCEGSVREMHRPIYASNSALQANVDYQIKRTTTPIRTLTPETYDYISTSILEETQVSAIGSVSSYNLNTYCGRIFLIDEKRPVPFELHDSIRNNDVVALITGSLHAAVVKEGEGYKFLRIFAFRNISSTGRLKSLQVTRVQPVVQIEASP